MEFNSEGFYCHFCAKQVVDYSKKSISQIEKNMPKIECGIFKAEQIEPDLNPLVVPKGLKQFLYSLMAFIGLTSSKIYAQTNPKELKTIVLDANYSSSDTTFIIEKTKIEVESNKIKDVEETMVCKSKKDLMIYPRQRLYFSSRFAFLILRRMHSYGYTGYRPRRKSYYKNQ